jgi:ferrous iron transport protein A
LHTEFNYMELKLSELSVGQKAVIVSLGDEELLLKMMEMGFLPGEDVIVEQVAPHGDPISVMIAGYQVSLRINEADSIIVETK